MKPALLVAALALAACAAPVTDLPPAPGLIALERGPCGGRCATYRVVMDAQGVVRFEDRRGIAQPGATRRLGPRAFPQLLDELSGLGVFGLAASYRAGDAGCRQHASDMAQVTIEVREGSRATRIVHDTGCRDAPAALRAIEARIEAATGVGQWLGQPPDR